jgi:hypothetical protein
MARNHELGKALLSSYPAFAYSRVPGIGHQNVLWCNVALTAAMAMVLVISSWIDGTLWMQGRAVGFLEHPGIITFLLAQAYVPFVAVKAVEQLAKPEDFATSALSPSFIANEVAPAWDRYSTSVKRKDGRGWRLYKLLFLIGFLAVAWNSIQNQDPIRFVHFDFWDSALHPFGYWSTRVYKSYLWLLIIPAITHLLILSALSVRAIIIAAGKTKDGLVLDPYHEDGCGGVKVIVNALLRPMRPIALLAALLAFDAFYVHAKFDLTTIGGFTLTLAFFAMIYVTPAISLRRTIRREKQRQIQELRKKQTELYSSLYRSTTATVQSDVAQTILSLSEVCKNVANIPEWPQLRTALNIVAIAYASPAIAFIANGAKRVLQQYLPFN